MYLLRFIKLNLKATLSFVSLILTESAVGTQLQKTVLSELCVPIICLVRTLKVSSIILMLVIFNLPNFLYPNLKAFSY
jgi:hypothetical protein